jgi:hypothetical protein
VRAPELSDPDAAFGERLELFDGRGVLAELAGAS